jgi:hypothetical protein
MSLEEALAEAATYSSSEKVPFTEISKNHGVVRSTLTRRHQGDTRPRDAVAADQQTSKTSTHNKRRTL